MTNVLTHADLTGLDIDLVAARLDQSVFTKPLETLGVRFVELSGSQRRLRENHRSFRELLLQRQYDVIHLNVFQSLSLWYAKAATQAGVATVIAHSHNTALRKSLGRPVKQALHRWGAGHYAPYITHRWACSSQAAQFMFGNAGATFIPNGVDIDRFRFAPEARRTVRKELDIAEKTLVIGNVGRLCDQKNQSFLLDALAAVQRVRPDSLLLLVGEGDCRPALEEKAQRLGIRDRVIFYGAADRVERLLWAMDVFALPSRFEGLPVSLVEAQAAGLPAVCSSAITREAGLLETTRFVDLEPETWAQAIADATAPDRQAAAQTVRERGFDMTDVAQRVTDCWKGGSGGGEAPARL